MRRFDKSVVDGAELEARQPARAASIVADVLVPVLQAGVSAVLVASVVTLGAVRVWGFSGDVGALWAGAALTSVTVAWFLLLGQHRRLLWAVERLTGSDLDGDRQAGAPVVRVELQDGGRRSVFADLPGDASDLALLARGVLGGRSLAEGVWTGRGGPFSRSEFRQLRGVLVERGFAVWRNRRSPSQGVELTAAGRAVFRRLAALDGTDGTLTRTHAHARGDPGGAPGGRSEQGRGL